MATRATVDMSPMSMFQLEALEALPWVVWRRRIVRALWMLYLSRSRRRAHTAWHPATSQVRR